MPKITIEDNTDQITIQGGSSQIMTEVDTIEDDSSQIETNSRNHWCNCIESLGFAFYIKSPTDKTNNITTLYDSFIPPDLKIEPMPNICSLWGITVFIILLIYYIIWGVWVLFISIIYFVMLFISMLFIIPYYIFIVIRGN